MFSIQKIVLRLIVIVFNFIFLDEILLHVYLFLNFFKH